MPTVFDQLHTDHINVTQLLAHFEKELEDFTKSESEPNYLKWQNILLYMTTYQDIFHHPTEEKLFAYLKNSDVEVQQAIDEIESQHEMLYEKSKALTEVISSVETNYISMQKSDLVEICQDYINLLKAHMSLEESVVFPFAKKNLKEEEWKAFESESEQMADPLFSDQRRAEFSELYQCICAQ